MKQAKTLGSQLFRICVQSLASLHDLPIEDNAVYKPYTGQKQKNFSSVELPFMAILFDHEMRI